MRELISESRLLGHLDRLAELQQHGRTSAPINIEIDLSNRCSLGCVWCHFAYTHTRGPLAGKVAKPDGASGGGDLMSRSLALRIVAQLAPLNVSVTWTGGGEPTLSPHFDELIEAAERAGIAQGLYTHGGHIDETRAGLLKRALTFVYVSLDAVDGASYQHAKGVNRFPDACEGIKRLARAEGNATVGVGYLVTRGNWRQTAWAADLADELGADFVQFRPTIAYDQETPGEQIEDTDWITEALERLEQVAATRTNVLVDPERFRMYQHWDGHPYRTCWWSALQTVITPNGKLWTCVNKREHPAAELGDLTQESFEEIWARHSARQVDGGCRVMCRGHLGNTLVEDLLTVREHGAFV